MLCTPYEPLPGYPGLRPTFHKERAKSLSLLACNWVQEQCIIGHTKKRIIRGVCLGSSVLNPVDWPVLYRWEGQGELVQSLEPC